MGVNVIFIKFKKNKKNPLENAKKPNVKHTININIHFKNGLEYTKMTFTSLSQVTTSQVMTHTHTGGVCKSVSCKKKL